MGPGCVTCWQCWWENPLGGQETGWEVGRWFEVTCGRGSSRKQLASQFLREGDRSPGAAGGPSCCLARLVDGLREPRAHPQRLSRRGQPPAPVSLLPSRSAHEEGIHLSAPLPTRGSHPPLTPQRTWGRGGRGAPTRAHVDETGPCENPTANARAASVTQAPEQMVPASLPIHSPARHPGAPPCSPQLGVPPARRDRQSDHRTGRSVSRSQKSGEGIQHWQGTGRRPVTHPVL